MKARKYSLLLLCLATSVSCANVKNEPISIQNVNTWMIQKSEPNTKFIRIQKRNVIYSVQHKEDLLLEVDYIDFRGVEGCCTGILVRPYLKKAKHLFGSIYGVKVMDLNGDGISEIEKYSFNFGQGYKEIIRTIDNVDGWNLHELHRAVSSSNTGLYDRTDPEYKDENVSFKYYDFNNDGIKDLEEDWTVVTAKEEKSFKKRYLFLDGKFVMKQ